MTETKSWDEHQGRVLDSVKGFDVIDCRLCGFKNIKPIPDQEELQGLCREEYYSVDKPPYLGHHREDLDWRNLAYSERHDSFERLLSPHRHRVLDMGSGPGFFVLDGKRRCHQTL